MHTNAELIKKSLKYEMIEMNDEDDTYQKSLHHKSDHKKKRDRSMKDDKNDKKSNNNDDKSTTKVMKTSLESKKDKHRHHRNKDYSSEEDQTVIRRKPIRIDQEQQDINNKLNDNDKNVELINKDILERDAFITRLLEKDEIKTKKLHDKDNPEIITQLTAKQIEELATRGSISTSSILVGGETGADHISTIDQLRELSRQHYLEKREEKELKLLEMSLRDEQGNSNTTTTNYYYYLQYIYR